LDYGVKAGDTATLAQELGRRQRPKDEDQACHRATPLGPLTLAKAAGKIMMKKIHLLGLIGGLALLGSVTNASAAMITGTTNIIGTMNPVGALPNATGVDFGFAMAVGGTGDLAALDNANTAAGTLKMTDFSFNPLTPGQTVWSTDLLGGLTFTLESANITQNATTLTLNGVGFITGNNYETTKTIFVLTLNKLDGQVTGSLSSSVAAVPIPGAALLFGSALFGLAAVARRKAGRRVDDDQTT
jgi:hypothetical protein